MVTAPIAVNSRGLEGSVDERGRRGFRRAVGIAIGTVALGAVAALLVSSIEDQRLTPAGGASARAQLPGDLFAAPRTPMPRIVVRYMLPRYTPSTPVATAPVARPSPTPRHHPTPPPPPGGGGDN